MTSQNNNPAPAPNRAIPLLVFLIILLAGYLLFSQTGLIPKTEIAPPAKENSKQLELPKDLAPETIAKAFDNQIVNVVKKSSPAVVSIIASAEVPVYEQYYQQSPFSNDPFFQDFFGDSFGFQVPEYRQKGTEMQRVGAGTGFIVSNDGYIITNKHVVSKENAEYTVILNDEKYRGEKIVAKVLARDPVKDIAILKIEKNHLPYLETGDSDKLAVGQTVIAIGYALGEFDNTVSKGVVSGLSRSITASAGYGQSENLEGIIQTDAAVNPGNSGGPLLDITGKIIGVNVAVAQGSENIGFALPINDVKRVYEIVKEKGVIEYPFLGVRYLLINEEVKKQNNLQYDYGALVIRGETPADLSVIPGSAADKAGIVENDIILEVNNARVNTDNQLSRLILKYRVGQEITLKISHKGQEKTVKVTLEARK